MQLIQAKPDFKTIPASFHAIEIEVSHYFQMNLKEQSQLRQWVKRKKLLLVPRLSLSLKKDPVEYPEMIQIWNETFPTQTLYWCIHSGKKKWDSTLHENELKKLPHSSRVFFEWNRDDDLKSTSFLMENDCFLGFLIDPHWHSKFISKLKHLSLHFKLHGWNDQRWVRRYGEALIQKVCTVLKKKNHSTLCLAYSGKNEEALFFSSHLVK